MRYTRLFSSVDSLDSTENGSGVSTPSKGALANAEVDLDDVESCEELSTSLRKVNNESDSTECVSNESDKDESDKLCDSEKEVGNQDNMQDCLNEKDLHSVTEDEASESAIKVNVNEKDSDLTNIAPEDTDIVKKDNEKVTKKVKEFHPTEIKRYKLVVTYVFDFDLDSDVLVTNLDNNEVFTENTEDVDSLGDIENTEDVDSLGDIENTLTRQSSGRHGSKNNLLDSSSDISDSDSLFEDKLDQALEFDHMAGTCYHSDELDDCAPDDDNDTEGSAGDTQGCESKKDKNINTSQCSVKRSMCKGFIYYSSEAKLYQGDLYYSHCDLSKRVEMRKGGKYKLVRKLFRKVFPSQKYTMN